MKCRYVPTPRAPGTVFGQGHGQPQTLLQITRRLLLLHLSGVISLAPSPFAERILAPLPPFSKHPQMKTLRLPSASSSAFLRSLGFAVSGLSSVRWLSCQRSNNINASPFSSRAERIFDFEGDHFCDDSNNLGKDAALHMALSRLSGDFGKECMLSLRHFYRSRQAPVISTGSLKLDLALGIGGLPKGRIVEIYGREASGKTTLALHIVKEAQKLGGYCAYLDLENAMDPTLAESVGVDTENLLFARSNCAEDTLSMVDMLVKSGSVDVIVMDSVAALVSQCELDDSINWSQFDVHSRLLSQALRKIHFSLARSATLLVLVNQTRSNTKTSQVFGPTNEITCGGNALKFHAAVRMRIMKRGLIEADGEINGISVSVKVVKNKLGPAMKAADVDIGFGKGFFREAEVLELACKHGIIMKEENCYHIDGEEFKDRTEAEKFLSENGGTVEELVSVLRTQLFGANVLTST